MQNKNELIINRIKLLCDENNISINKLLQECNLSKSVIDNMKKGSIPTTDKISKIADYFEVSTDYLLCKTDDPTPPWKKYALPDTKTNTSKIDGLGNRIKLKLRQMEMTQRDLAQKLNVPILTLIDYITERKKPDAKTLDKLAKILNTSVEYLITGSVIDDPNPAGTQWEEDEPEIAALQRDRQKTPDRDKEKFDKILQIIFDEHFPKDEKEDTPAAGVAFRRMPGGTGEAKRGSEKYEGQTEDLAKLREIATELNYKQMQRLLRYMEILKSQDN